MAKQQPQKTFWRNAFPGIALATVIIVVVFIVTGELTWRNVIALAGSVAFMVLLALVLVWVRKRLYGEQR
jgi:hypothetical protein